MYPDIFIDLDFKRDEINSLKIKLKETSESKELLRQRINVLEDTISDLKQSLNALQNELTVGEGELEKYCMKRFKEIPMVAYKQKRTWQNKDITVALNQLFQYNQFAVVKRRNRLPLTGDVLKDIKKHGDYLAKTLVWTDDKTLAKSGDYYLYPEEILATKKGDCEDHAFALASIVPQTGVAYGFYEKGDVKYGHAWNVCVVNGKLYHIETTGKKTEIYDENNSNYIIHYIITSDKMYHVKGNVRFGEIAEWY